MFLVMTVSYRAAMKSSYCHCSTECRNETKVSFLRSKKRIHTSTHISSVSINSCMAPYIPHKAE